MLICTEEPCGTVAITSEAKHMTVAQQGRNRPKFSFHGLTIPYNALNS
jgi:hypothetical protein